jgi:hypothetical protein
MHAGEKANMLKPLFPFYGSKWRCAKRYPPPVPGMPVIEPFAGSAGYSHYWEPASVSLYDLDPIIVGVWSYLISVSAEEVLRLPDLMPGQSVDEFALPQEAKWLIGFWINRGSSSPKKRMTKFSGIKTASQLLWGQAARERIASQVDRIRHWTITHGSYDTVEPVAATWFVDPPYTSKGKYYRVNNVNHASLGVWCQGLAGNVIVCEQSGAGWLPFQPIGAVKSTKGHSDEVVWVNSGAENCRPAS